MYQMTVFQDDELEQLKVEVSSLKQKVDEHRANYEVVKLENIKLEYDKTVSIQDTYVTNVLYAQLCWSFGWSSQFMEIDS